MNKIKLIDKIRFKLGLYPHYWYGWTRPKDYGKEAMKMDKLNKEKR